jgi:hypothetical protein
MTDYGYAGMVMSIPSRWLMEGMQQLHLLCEQQRRRDGGKESFLPSTVGPSLGRTEGGYSNTSILSHRW